MFNIIQQFNSQLFFNLHQLVGYSETTDLLIYFFAQIADMYVIAAAMLSILLYQHKRSIKSNERHFLIKELFLMTFAVMCAWFVAHFLKLTIGGLRPFEFYASLEPLFLYAGGDTFPSGHATLFSALSLMLTAFHRNAGLIFIVVAMLISLARVISGVHFPIDILAGWIIGAGVSYAVYFFFKKQPLR